MPATQVGIVYATGSKILRRIIVPDDDGELDHPSHLQPGESMHKHPRAQPYDEPAAGAAIMAVTGAPAIPTGRCAVVDQKTQLVIGFARADPVLDAHPAGKLVASDVADVNWKHDGVQFLARYVQVDAKGVVTGVTWSATPVAGIPNSTADIGQVAVVQPIQPVVATGTDQI